MGRGISGGGSIILVEFPGLIGQVLFFTRNIKSHPKVSIEDQFTKMRKFNSPSGDLMGKFIFLKMI